MEPITATGDTGTIEFDGRTLTITKRNASLKETVQRVAVDQITGIELKTAGTFAPGRITFNVPGASGTTRMGAFGLLGGLNTRGAYTLTFQIDAQPRMEALRDAVEAVIHGDRPAAGDGPAGLLRQLGELRDAGVLTDDEFEAAKGRVLARL